MQVNLRCLRYTRFILKSAIPKAPQINLQIAYLSFLPANTTLKNGRAVYLNILIFEGGCAHPRGGGECCFFLGNKVKKTMSKCHIHERSHVTKPLLLSNNVIISPTEHAQ